MDISPSTKLYLLRGVPITNNYKDTLYFANKTKQYNYFYGKRIQTYEDFTYQRVEKGKVRVALGAESCYSCNYMMFQNTNFGTKWFYAFITGVEYINNECTEITYEIDKVQTWWYDLTVKPCMVERQHATNDTEYANCESEPLNVDAKYVNWEQTAEGGNVFVTLTTGHVDSNTSQWVHATTYLTVNNIPCALEITYFPDTALGKQSLADYIQAIVGAGKEEAIIGIYCAPAFVGLAPTTGIPTFDDYGANKSSLRTGAFQGYQPRNKKLYNYPFCKLEARSPTASQEYAIEDFRTGTGVTQLDSVNFRLYAITVPSPSLLFVPRYYRGEDLNYETSLEINDFPYVPFNGDTFMMWMVQNTSGYAANILGQLGSTVLLGAASGFTDTVGLAIGLRQTVQETANMFGQAINAWKKPNNAYGLSKANIFSNLQINGFRLQCKTIDYWQARQIDTYFDMYGYAMNRVTTPNVHARKYWTYIKTGGCTLIGNAPSDDISFVEDCLNNGITWWADGDNDGVFHVGEYNLVNSTL